MTIFKRTLFTVVAGVSLLFAAACGGEEAATNNNPEPENNAGEEQQDEATGDEKSANYPTTVTLGTASQGGTYFIYGSGLGELMNKELGVTSNVEVTGGPVHNMQLVQSGDLDVGLATLGPAYEGYLGEGEWTGGKKLEDVRIVFPMYTTPFHWWSVDPSVQSIDDINTKPNVGEGPAGGTSGTYLPIIHELLGVEARGVQAGASDMVGQQLDGQLDVIGYAAGIPISAVSEVEAQREINFFGLSGDQRDQVIERLPYFDKFTIPAGTYENLTEDLETIAMFNFGIVHKDMDEQFVYDLVKAYHENNDFMVNTHRSAEEAVPEAILKNKVVPLHPGAIRYYEEIGIEIPDAVK